MARRGLSADDADKIAERQKKVQDALYAAMDPATMKEDFAQIYSDVFTKEELAGIADFYDTPSGQAMISKMPEIQQKTMQVIMPRVMQAMAQVQQSMGPAAPSGGVQPAAAAAPAGSAPAAAGSAGKP
jgi:hypothetical protein